MKVISLSLVIFFSVSCIKTAEQLQREKRIDSMTEQMKDSQGLVADMVTQIKDMQSQMDKLNGRLEEIEHRMSKFNPETMEQLNQNLTLIKTQQETNSAELSQIQTELKEQRSFIEKVTTSLASVKSAPANQKKSPKSELNAALALIKKNNYSKARQELEPLIGHPELTPGEQNKVLHGLGKVEFYTQNYEKSLIYFSKIFTKYPKASLAPSSLLFIGRSLKKMDKVEEAKEAFKNLIQDYPGTSEALDAKKEL
jgi:TolA-binding protein